MLSRIGYIFRETWASLRRNVTLTVAAILTSAVSLFLVGGTFMVREGFDNLLSKWEGGVQMPLFTCRILMVAALLLFAMMSSSFPAGSRPQPARLRGACAPAPRSAA